MFVVTERTQWAGENFGECALGDKRRSTRLVRMAEDLARHAGSSLLKSCDGDEAAAEGMYRLLRNAEVAPCLRRQREFQVAAGGTSAAGSVGRGAQCASDFGV